MATRRTPPSAGSPYGTVFHPETGKLYLFDDRCIQVLGPAWPKPRAWRCLRRKPGLWRGTRPAIRLWRDLEAIITRSRAALDGPPEGCPSVSMELRVLRTAEWMQSIPEEIRTSLEPFPVRHWHLLSLMAACGSPALDLVHSTPALAFALASNWVFHKPAVQRPLRSARGLLGLGRSQRDLLEWLGFRGTRSALRILRKLPMDCIRIDKLLYLRDAMNTPDLNARIRHLPALNAGVLRVATDLKLAPFVTPRVLQELAAWTDPEPYSSPAYLLSDACRMLEQFHPEGFTAPKLHSLEGIRAFHDEIVEAFNGESVPDMPFQRPPFLGDHQFEPIFNSRELQEEGRQQSNCIGSYWEAGVAGLYAFYRVLSPERATLCLRRSLTAWHIQGLELSHNRKPSEATSAHVQAWLEWQIGRAYGCPPELEEEL